VDHKSFAIFHMYKIAFSNSALFIAVFPRTVVVIMPSTLQSFFSFLHAAEFISCKSLMLILKPEPK